MADVSVTAASVLKTSTTRIDGGIAGATLTAGQAVFKDSSDSEWKLADSNDTAAKAAAGGITLNGGGDGQPIDIATGGNITPGATLTLGEVYCVSTTAGGICPISDVTAGQYMTVLGVATATNVLKVNIIVSGVVKA